MKWASTISSPAGTVLSRFADPAIARLGVEDAVFGPPTLTCPAENHSDEVTLVVRPDARRMACQVVIPSPWRRRHKTKSTPKVSGSGW